MIWFFLGLIIGASIVLLWVALDKRVHILNSSHVILDREEYENMEWFIERVIKRFRVTKEDLEEEEENENDKSNK